MKESNMGKMHREVIKRELSTSVTCLNQPLWLSTFEQLLKLADIAACTEDSKKESVRQDSCHSYG